MGGNTPSKFEQDPAVKFATTATNVVGTIMMFVPGGQIPAIILLAGTKSIFATQQIYEGETKAGLKNLGLAAITAAPGLGEFSKVFDVSRSNFFIFQEMGQYISLLGNTLTGAARVVDSYEKGDIRGCILNSVQVGAGVVSGVSGYSGGSTETINKVNIAANTIYAGDASYQIVKKLSKKEEVDLCDLLNNTCTLVSSAKMIHDSALKLRELNSKDSIDFDLNNPPGERVQRKKNGEEVWKLENGNYFKKGLDKTKVLNYLDAEKLGIGVPILKANVELGFVEMMPGISLDAALENGLVTQQIVESQVNHLRKVLNDNKMAHTDPKIENIMYFPDEKRVFLIDNGDVQNYNENRHVWTPTHRGIPGNATTQTKMNMAAKRPTPVGPNTDDKGFNNIKRVILLDSEKSPCIAK